MVMQRGGADDEPVGRFEPSSPEQPAGQDPADRPESQPAETDPQEQPRNPFLNRTFDDSLAARVIVNRLLEEGFSEDEVREMHKAAMLHQEFNRRLDFVQEQIDELEKTKATLRLAYDFASANSMSSEQFRELLRESARRRDLDLG